MKTQTRGKKGEVQMKKLDRIEIRDLQVFGNHGVLEEENVLGQKFLVSATLYTDTRKAGEEDSLVNTIHYGDICYVIRDFMRENTFQLIEAAAEHLARHLLIETEGLEAIDLEIKKPWAPIALPLDYVSVKISRGWHRAYISLGSNIGDRMMYLEDAVATLEADRNCQVIQVTDWIETKPYGGVEQEDFLNGCMELRTVYSPDKLLEVLQDIEQQAGRERKIHWGPRTLDLDILLYDDLVIDSKRLTIPHMDMHNREFVLAPMTQIAAWRRHPLFHKTMKELYEELQQKLKEKADVSDTREETSEKA